MAWCKYCATQFDGTGDKCPDCMTVKDSFIVKKAAAPKKDKEVKSKGKGK